MSSRFEARPGRPGRRHGRRRRLGVTHRSSRRRAQPARSRSASTPRIRVLALGAPARTVELGYPSVRVSPCAAGLHPHDDLTPVAVDGSASAGTGQDRSSGEEAAHGVMEQVAT